MWGGEENEACNVNLCLELALATDGSEASVKSKKYPKGYAYGTEREVDVDGGNTSESDTRGGRGRNGSRKKLQLTKEQTQLLEGYFRWSPTLDPVQKHELALRLSLQPRQVEVWFQNRRARTKMKQTEEECEVLKRCCESLREENQRLKMELCDLKTCLGSRAASTSVCSSCHKHCGGGGGGGGGEASWWFN